MVCLGFEPGVAGWKAQTNPLSYGGTPCRTQFYNTDSRGRKKVYLLLDNALQNAS